MIPLADQNTSALWGDVFFDVAVKRRYFLLLSRRCSRVSIYL